MTAILCYVNCSSQLRAKCPDDPRPMQRISLDCAYKKNFFHNFVCFIRSENTKASAWKDSAFLGN